MPRRVHHLQGETADTQRDAIFDKHVRRRLRRLLAKALHPLRDRLLVGWDVDVLGSVALPVPQEPLLLGVHHDLAAARLP